MRVKTEIWVKALLRQAMAAGAAGYVVTSGDESAGAVFIHVDNLKGDHWLYGPAPAGLAESADERRWTGCFDVMPVGESEIAAYLARQRRFDPDLWLVALEDRDGRHFLGDQLVAPAVRPAFDPWRAGGDGTAR